MAGFDDPGVFFSDNLGSDDPQPNENDVNLQASKRRFKDFIREYHEGNFVYVYRDQLKNHYNLGKFCLEVSLEDLGGYDEELQDKLTKQPTEYLPLFDCAATELADEITKPRPEGEEDVRDVQVVLKTDGNPSSLRDLKSDLISKLVQVSGIVTAMSGIRAKATRIAIQCRTCKNVIPNLQVKPGLEGYMLPRKCTTDQAGQLKCPIDPYFIIPDKCTCVDFQLSKLQECPESVPHGEMPRQMQLYCDRSLCERVVPGNRVTVIGIYSIKKISKTSRKGAEKRVAIGIRSPYLRVVGIQVDTSGVGRTLVANITPEEEEKFRLFASDPEVYDKITRSIAPSIFGSPEIKKAVACLLFGGARKRLPDGLTRRGDINVLLIGDPGTAKSQLLKFAERVSPIGIYTSGKGSSAAGLTASVTRDPTSRNFIMEGGAMVLADGGVVCIDEFDKMREDDRVAIHEAMEQQTISIAKAGITTTLNTRCSVLAAANSIFGRWDDTKGDENIDFMPTILSRFDMIFIVKDEHNKARDITMAKHVMNVHLNANRATTQAEDGELSLDFLRRYISFCRARCGPRLSAAAGEKLKKHYVDMRSGARQYEEDTSKRSSIPITVRQLEAVIRISESLAKMQLRPHATETHVEEALRLFSVSTMDAATSGSLAGAEGFTSKEDQEAIDRIEKQLKRRLAVGSQVAINNIVTEFVVQKFPEHAVRKVIHLMIVRGELQHRFQRKMIFRLR